MPRKLHYRHAVTLEPGYYLLRVKTGGGGKAGSLFFESENGTVKETEIQFKEGGSILLCLREPTKIGVGEQHQVVLDYTRLGPARIAYTKILHRRPRESYL